MRSSAGCEGRREIGAEVIGWWTIGDRVLLKLDDDRQVQLPMLERECDAMAPGLRAVVELLGGEIVGWRLPAPPDLPAAAATPVAPPPATANADGSQSLNGGRRP